MDNNDYVTEAEALSDWLVGCDEEVEEAFFDEDGEMIEAYDLHGKPIDLSKRGKLPEQSHKSRLFKSNYDRNKAVKVGEELRCPVCGTKVIKTTYHKIFCGRPRCKDLYWNTVDVKRRERAKLFK